MRLVAIVTALACAAVVSPHVPLLVWNASASAPRGLYGEMPLPGSRRGDLVLVAPPAWVRDLAARRGYLPARVPLIKRIAATSGDIVCRDGTVIRINRAVVAQARNIDSHHRNLPRWFGCVRLDSRHDFLLMTNVADSFDGRYFGVTPTANNHAKLVPLWTY